MAKYADGTHQQPLRCKYCLKPRTQRRYVSTHGSCHKCATKAMNAAIEQQKLKRGPIWQKRTERLIERALRDLEQS